MKKSQLLVLIVLFALGSIYISRTKMADISNYSFSEVKSYAKKHELELIVDYEYSSDIPLDKIIHYSKNKDTLTVGISKGIDYQTLYETNKVDELGLVPIMMYHGIVDKTDNLYTGGNVDKAGYHRTASAFKADLEFFYQNNYRMIRLKDYIAGQIKTEMGKSPIVLTFDDGLVNNFNVIGEDENGLIIDPNSAVGILESFKKKYPDFEVTATFFLNGSLFRQSKYNDKILKWLISNNYDIGNHTYNHLNLSKIEASEVSSEVAKLYKKLDSIIPNQYVNIVALPYGIPYSDTHENFSSVLKSSYQGKNYETTSAMKVGWDSNVSPFSVNFKQTMIKRIRAYDNNGLDFDIEMNFKQLEKRKYISDGDAKTIVVPKEKINDVAKSTRLVVKTY